jgi:hypothetical protein
MANTEAAAAPSAEAPGAGQPPFFELSRLMVVAVDTSTSFLSYKAQTKPNGPWEANWTPIDKKYIYTLATSGLTKDGRVAVAGQIQGGGIAYIDESTDQSGGIERWNAPVLLGSPGGNTNVVSLSMARDVDGRVEIFAVAASTGTIWWIYQNPDQIVEKDVTITPPGTTTPITVKVQERVPPATPWSGWQQIPGGLISIKACRQGDGRIALFGINSNNNLYRCVQANATTLKVGDWSQWVQMDDALTGKILYMAPVVGPMGALHLFAINTNKQVIHTLQRPAATDTWTPWLRNGFSRTGFNMVAPGLDGNGHLMLVAADATNVISANTQTNPAALAWTGWQDIANSSWPVQLALDYNADGRLALFSHWLLPPGSGIGGLWTISQAAIDSTEWELEWTQLAASSIQQYSVVRDLTPPAS